MTGVTAAGLGGLDAWPVGWAAAGAVRRAAGVVARRGDDRPAPWASVTKLVTAYAVLVAAEEGAVGLDDPAGPPGATVRHLLAHASGLGPDDGRVLAAPGRRRVYSNAGYQVLAGHLAARSGLAFDVYVAEAVLRPLGLDGTRLGPGDSPAWGAVGPLGDLLALAAEWLAPRLVSPTTLAQATAVAFPGLDGVLPGFGPQSPCDWGLGFELRDAKAPHWTGAANSPATFGHFGRSGAMVWVDPVAGLGCAALADRAFGPWAARAWPELSDAVLAAHAPGGGGQGR